MCVCVQRFRGRFHVCIMHFVHNNCRFVDLCLSYFIVVFLIVQTVCSILCLLSVVVVYCECRVLVAAMLR